MDKEYLIKVLKFKVDRNASYFLVIEPEIRIDNIKVQKNGMLLPTKLTGSYDDDIVYLSVLYRIDPDKFENSEVDKEEGLIKLPYSDLADLVINKSVVAFYTEKRTEDTEIRDILRNIFVF